MIRNTIGIIAGVLLSTGAFADGAVGQTASFPDGTTAQLQWVNGAGYEGVIQIVQPDGAKCYFAFANVSGGGIACVPAPSPTIALPIR